MDRDTKLAAIKGMLDAGTAVFPIKVTDEGKFPAVNYSGFREVDDVDFVLSFWEQNIDFGVGLSCSNGVKGIDIDSKNYDGDLTLDYLTAVSDNEGDEILTKVVIETTKNGGVHLIFKCFVDHGSSKLARRAATDDEVKNKGFREGSPVTLIETRGEGGFFAIWPTVGYELKQGSFDNLPELTEAEFTLLCDVATKIFDTYKEPQVERKERKKPTKEVIHQDITTVDEFNLRFDVVSYLIENGWKYFKEKGNSTYLTRPGKTTGISADFDSERRKLMVFTSNSVFEPEKAYSPFGVYSLMEHNENDSKAAKELYQQGYGTRIRDEKPDNSNLKMYEWKGDDDDEEEDEIWKITMGKEYDPMKKIEPIDWRIFIMSGGKKQKLAYKGSIGFIVAKPKAGKSTLSLPILASVLENYTYMNFYSTMNSAWYFDTEQPEAMFQDNMLKMQVMIGKKEKHPNFRAWPLRHLSKKERFGFVKKCLAKLVAPELIIIDGIVDFVKDFNDFEEASAIMDFFMQFTSRTGTIVIFVLHLAKTTGEERGALGTIAQEKSDWILGVEVEDGVHTVKSRFQRGASLIIPFDFRWNDRGMPVVASDERYAKLSVSQLYSFDLDDDDDAPVLIRHSSLDNEYIEEAEIVQSDAIF